MKKGFTIPLQDQVYNHIKKTMTQWPDEFIRYYADRFWNHYQAAGWKLSNGNAMKDWQAAFNANWKSLKFKEDIEHLNKCMAKDKVVTERAAVSGPAENIWQEIDQLLAQYKARPTSVPFDKFGQYYMIIAKNNMLRQFSEDERAQIRASYDNDQGKCRCAAVQMTFDSYVNTGVTFCSIVDLRNRFNG